MTILFENVLSAVSLPDRTGSTPQKQTTAARLGTRANVLDFGADPSGNTVSTSAVQAAVNWQTLNGNRGALYFPIGRYVIDGPISLPQGSFHIYGDGVGSHILAGFNGFVFDQLSVPYGDAGQGIVIERLRIENNYSGQNPQQAASSSWAASGSPVTINVPSLDASVKANCLVYILDQRVAPMPVFVGITSSVVAGTSITLPTTAVGSGGITNLTIAFVQCYAASATWLINATTITMPGSPPAGVPTNCLVFDYDRILRGDDVIQNIYTEALGVGNWSGSTVTFTAGVSQASQTSGDRLIFAPLSGAIRLSSTVSGTIRDCVLTGFMGVTTSQDNVNSSGQQLGAESYSVVVQGNSISNGGHAAAIGSVGLYLTNNSLSDTNDINAFWIGTRLSGFANSIIAGRTEVCTFGIDMQGESNTGNTVAGANLLAGFTMESNAYSIVQGGGSGRCQITAINIICQDNHGQYGLYIGGGQTLISACTIQGNWAGYAIHIPDPGTSAGLVTFISVIAANNNGGGLGAWRIPAQAWWGTCIQCNNPALTYTFANLPSGVSSPTPTEGDTYDITNCSTSTFLATAAAGGSGATAHRRVRWNAAATAWQVIG